MDRTHANQENRSVKRQQALDHDERELLFVSGEGSHGVERRFRDRAEHDALSNDVLVAVGSAIDDGVADVPDAPGAGLAIDEARFASEATFRFDVSL